MFMLIVYEQWRGIPFLGDHFRAVERERKLCVLILVYLGSALVGLCRPPLCHCGIFDPVFLCEEWWEDLIRYIEDPTVVGKFSTFFVKTYIPFLKDACAFVLPFRSSRLIV